jgi:hypothetical protein
MTNLEVHDLTKKFYENSQLLIASAAIQVGVKDLAACKNQY